VSFNEASNFQFSPLHRSWSRESSKAEFHGRMNIQVFVTLFFSSVHPVRKFVWRLGSIYREEAKVILFLCTWWYTIHACQTKVNVGRSRENLVLRTLQNRLVKTRFKRTYFHFFLTIYNLQILHWISRSLCTYCKVIIIHHQKKNYLLRFWEELHG